MPQERIKARRFRKWMGIVAKTFLYIILFVLVIFLLLQTGPVQNLIKDKAVAFLERKLQTKVSVANLRVGFPQYVTLSGVYLEDRSKDTLLAGGKVSGEINLWRLITKNEVKINSIALEDVVVNFSRNEADSEFNYQFVVDAFTVKKDTSNIADTSAMVLELKSVDLNRVRFDFYDQHNGTDASVYVEHFDTRFDEFNPVDGFYKFPSANINGLNARIFQLKPLAAPEPAQKDIEEAREMVPLTLLFDKADLKNVNVEYRNDVSGLYSLFNVGHLEVNPDNLDLRGRKIAIDRLVLENSSSTIRVTDPQQAKVIAEEVAQEVVARAQAGWDFRVNEIDINDIDFRFDDENKPRVRGSMDYAHLAADSFNLEATDVIFNTDTISGNIASASFREQSGFELDQLQTSFLYSSREISLENLYLKTPGTELKRSASIRYASFESLKYDIGNMYIDLDLDESRLLVRDLLTFVPALRNQPAFAWPDATWYIDSRLHGKLSSLQIDQLDISGLSNTRINISGTLSGLPAMKNIYADLDIHEARSSKRDLQLFLPARSLPQNITLPSTFVLSGALNGNGSSINTDLSLATSLGWANVRGRFSNLDRPEALKYNAVVRTRGLQAGTIFRVKEPIGPISATFNVSGTGTTATTADVIFKGNVDAVRYNDYSYRNLDVKGTYVNQLLDLTADMNDPNIDFNIDASADLSADHPSMRITGMIDSLKLQNLHFSKSNMILRTAIDGNFSNLDPDNLEGKLFLTQTLFVNEDQRLQMDTVEMIAGRTTTGNFISLNSDVVTARLEGQYRLTQMGNIIHQSISPYFNLPSRPSQSTAPYDFTLNAYVVDNPALKAFIPDLKRIDSVSLQSRFSSTEGWDAVVSAPVVDIGVNSVRNLKLNAGSGDSAVNIVASVDRFSSGNAIQLDNTSVRAQLADNKIDFVLNSKDRAQRDKYNISGIISQPTTGSYQLSLRNDSLLLNYDQWTVSSNNAIVFGKGNISAKDLLLSQGGQQLLINSNSLAPGSPMNVNFTNFELATLTGFIQTDSTFANGLVNGNVVFTSFTPQPVFTGNITVNDFSFKGDTVGNVQMQVNNRTAGAFNTDLTLSGRGNDLRLTGTYYPQRTGNNFDFDLNVTRLPMETVQAFSEGAIYGSSGYLSGNFDVGGSFADPEISGDLNFNNTGFTLGMLNSYFTINNEKISISNQGFTFNNFAVRDSAGNALRLDGNIGTTNYKNFTFNLDITARNFLALNSTKRNDALFYGRLFFDTDLRVRGTSESPYVDGDLFVNEDTRMTVVLPQKGTGIVEREGVIEFVDMDAPLNDSLFLSSYDSLNFSGFRGMDIAVNLEIDRQAEFNLIVDEGNGDFINIKGEALITAGVDPSGKINLNGSYEIDEGSYQLTFNFLRRKFDIQKGSRIVWAGEPTNATIDVEAVYIANTAPLDLVKNQIGNASEFERNTYLQKLPFNVHLYMEGELLKPQIRFDIELPDGSYPVAADIVTNVRTRLDQLRQEPGEMNKQVFSLLLLNRFIDENPFSSSMGGINPGTLARQSVSKLLTEQLNRLAGDLIAGVDLSFDILSAEDYTTGQRRDRTDLNVSLSKRLLNDRLTVTIGSNFELEGPAGSNYQGTNIAGNIAADYRISRDNRYVLRFYRRNEYEGVIDGYIVETGVGFIITVDYNRFREIFLSRDERQQRRERRRNNRQERRQERRTERQQVNEEAANLKAAAEGTPENKQ